MENFSARIDHALKALKEPPVRDQMVDFEWELRSLKLFSMLTMEIRCVREVPNWDSIRIDIEDLLEEVERKERVEEWENFGSVMLPKLETLKTKVKELCVDFSMEAFVWSNLDMDEYMNSILWNLWGFLNNKGGVSASLKKKMWVFYGSLRCSGNVYRFSLQRCRDGQKMEEIRRLVEGVVNYAACFSVLCWTDSEDGEDLSVRLDSMLRKINPCYNPMVMEMYFGVLISSKSSQHDKFAASDIAVNLCDLLLEDVVIPNNDLREGLIFLITFLMSPPPERHDGDELLARICVVVSGVASSNCAIRIPHESGQGLVELQAEVGKVMDEIREICVQNISFSGSNFPVTNGIGFIDNLLGNLKEVLQSRASSVHFVINRILSIEEDLMSMRPFLKDVVALKMENQGVRDLWNRLVNASYLAEHAIDSFFVVHAPIWYDMQRLFEVTEEIKAIKTEVQKLIIDLEMCKGKKLVDEHHSHPPLPRQADTSRMEDGIVGFTDEMQLIIDRLKGGTTRLDIVSIVGMPGQGKTTLAKMVYHHPFVNRHFHRLAWCCVSQVYQMKELLIDILSTVTADADIRSSSCDASEHDLAEMLRKSLKGRRFLIVMDDIWDIRAFDGIKRSFPDDGNGSRIVFTTRIHNLVLQANPNCDPHPIRPLDDKESWELLQRRLDGYPLELSEVGKEIASKCKGLPLAVVLVAGILSRKDKNLDFWKEILGNMAIATNDCLNLVELSYIHLPDCLKPCFLYFGSFPEDGIINVKKLIRLWTAEGFVPRNDVKMLDNIAREYLMDLIDRSLVTVADRNSTGEVRACRVHDILHDFCLSKAKEERFLHKVANTSGFPSNYEQYRLCIAVEPKIFIDSRPTGSYVRSLLFSCGEVGYGTRIYGSFSFQFKFLHVLDMECISLFQFFPDDITSMVHLRYFAVYFPHGYLPSSIAALQNLETLVAKGVHKLPDAIGTIKTLRYIIVEGMAFKDYKQDSSYQLENVVTLSRAILTNEKDAEVLSQRLPKLRKLVCEFNVQLDFEDTVQFPDFSGLSQLESLHLMVDYNLDFGSKYDNALSSFNLPSTLKKLNLRFFDVTKSAISRIGKLPNLQVLKLVKSKFENLCWELQEGEFLNLKVLDLYKVRFQHWKDCDEPFPCLEHLILSC